MSEEHFLPPRAGKGVLSRARVNAILEAAKERGGQWIYVGAPGGFGKSLAVSQWLAPQRNKHAWITLDPYDNNEGRFVRKLLGGLAFAQRANRRLAHTVERVRPPFLECLFDALDLLLPNEKKYVLVLDDLHHLRDGAVLRALPLFRKRLPSAFTVCLLSRDEPPDVFLDAILKGDMTVLDARDLAFDEEELRRLLSRNGLSASQAPDLLRRTAGWPIAVRALLMGRETPEEAEKKRKMSPDEVLHGEELLRRYLDVHVWSGWGDRVQDFLMQASLPALLDGRLCRRLTGRQDSAEILESLSRNLAFVSRLGDGRYRLHDLFRDFLREKLAESPRAGEVHALEKKVADALFEEEDYYAAAAHYIRCSDSRGLSDCCAAFRRIAASSSIEDRIAFFKEYVIGGREELRKDLFEGNLPIMAQCAFVYYVEGDARQFLRLMDKIERELKGRSPKDDSCKKVDEDALQFFWVLRALDFRRPLDRYTDEFLAGRKDLEPLLAGGRLRVGTFTAAMPMLHRSLMDQSDLARGRSLYAQAERRRKAFTSFLGNEHLVILECHLAGILYESGRLPEACFRALKAQEMMETTPCRAEVRFSADLILSAILRGMGRRDEATRIEAETERRIEREGLLPLRPSLRTWRYASRIAGGDGTAAREWLDTYAPPLADRLPLYRMHQHFVTVRALLAVREDALAVLFGEKLLKLGMDFRRQLDVIEASLLLSIAHRNLGNRKKSLFYIERALKIAALCNFSRLFIDDAPALAPILDALLRAFKTRKALWIDFAVRVRAAMAGTDTASPPPSKAEAETVPLLNGRQVRILELLERNASYGEIAKDLGIAHSTAKYHVLRLYRALGASSAAEALARAGCSRPQREDGLA
ncbi:LuxR C-terminal-related transcriptional regulator [Fretibacterium fastidiosum]|uniref:ATP-dependent transcriptional regulator n=1 Tax=Fretibacterium fastidiosum TaxID=651822 RepID=A0AB94IXU3_9BACT|nr:ATP-dependent transcriptional regulator [Fretibacterium fastidiosum]CBL28504.1 ATP-dependent transcriptional regulator [Fretibacterium fastidiosum]